MNRAYVIMPVSCDREYAVKRGCIESVLGMHAVAPHFPLDHANNCDLRAIMETINSCRFAIVDLSFERPSCYYELGIVQAAGCTVIALASKDTAIHQMVGRDSVSFYANLAEYRGHLLREVQSLLHVATT